MASDCVKKLIDTVKASYDRVWELRKSRTEIDERPKDLRLVQDSIHAMREMRYALATAAYLESECNLDASMFSHLCGEALVHAFVAFGDSWDVNRAEAVIRDFNTRNMCLSYSLDGALSSLCNLIHKQGDIAGTPPTREEYLRTVEWQLRYPVAYIVTGCPDSIAESLKYLEATN